jgi:hypothetical protein
MIKTLEQDWHYEWEVELGIAFSIDDQNFDPCHEKGKFGSFPKILLRA